MLSRTALQLGRNGTGTGETRGAAAHGKVRELLADDFQFCPIMVAELLTAD